MIPSIEPGGPSEICPSVCPRKTQRKRDFKQTMYCEHCGYKISRPLPVDPACYSAELIQSKGQYPKALSRGPLDRAEVRDPAFKQAEVTMQKLGKEVISNTRDLMKAQNIKRFAQKGRIKNRIMVKENSARLGAAYLGGEITGVITPRTGGEGQSKPNVVIAFPPWAGPPQAEPVIDVEPAATGP